MKQSKKQQKVLKKQQKQQKQQQIKKKDTNYDDINKKQVNSQIKNIPYNVNDDPFNFNKQINQQEIIDFSFVIAQLNENHYHSLKTILQRYSNILSLNSSDIASTILQNKQIGNVSICDDEQSEQQDQQQNNDQNNEDQNNVYSILTIIPGKSKISQKIKNIFIKSFQKSSKYDKSLKSIIDNSNILVNERLSNLPAFIAQNSHQVMVNDLKKLKKETIKNFQEKIGNYLIAISEVQIQDSDELDSLIFHKFEDYQYATKSKVWWLGQKTHKKGIKADFRKFYYLISVDQYLSAASSLQKYIVD